MVMGLKISSQKQNLDCYNDAMIGSNESEPSRCWQNDASIGSDIFSKRSVFYTREKAVNHSIMMKSYNDETRSSEGRM